MIKLIFCTSLILCLTTSSYAFDTNEAAPGKIDLKSPSNHGSAIVAKGKGFEVNERQMEQVIASRVAANPEAEFPPDTEARVLTHLIEIQLEFQKATEAEKTEARKQNDAKVADIIKTMG